jgi:hypothetical protein
MLSSCSLQAFLLDDLFADHLFRGALLGVCLIVFNLETPTITQPRPKLGYCTTEEQEEQEESYKKIKRGLDSSFSGYGLLAGFCDFG